MLSRSPASLKAALSPQLRPANAYVGALGHSMLDQGNGNFGTAPNVQVIQSAGAFPWWVNVLSKGQYVIDRQSWLGAVSGTTSQQMANSAQITAAVTCRAGILFMMAATNDRPAGFALDDGTTAVLGSAGTVTVPNVKAMLNALVAAGKFVVLIIDPPRGSATYAPQRLTGAQLLNHVAYRNWCLQQVPRLYGGQVVVADTWPDFANNVTGTEGDVRDIAVRDGLHPAAPGSFFFARNRVLPAMQGWGVPGRQVPVLSKPDTFEATVNPRGAVNVARLGGLNSAAGGASGAQGGVTYAGLRSSGYGPAANAPAQAGTLTVTMTRNATSPQTGDSDWFEIAVTGTTATNAGPLIQFTGALQAAELASLAAGDRITCFDEFQIDAGGVGLVGLSYGLQRTTATVLDSFDLGSADQTTHAFDTILAAGPIAGFHDGEGQFLAIDKTETLLQQVWTVRMLESASPNFKVRFRNNAVRKVL